MSLSKSATLATLALLATSSGLLAQDTGDGRWFRMATEGAPAAASQPAGGEQQLDPDALHEIGALTTSIAGDLGGGATGDSVRARQQEVEHRLTQLIGMLEREGG